LERNGNPLRELPIMSIENPTLAHFRHFSSLFTLSPLYICRESSTNQLLFMQNKPNSLNVQIYINIYDKKVYKNETAFRRGKNKPNSNPIAERVKLMQSLYLQRITEKKMIFQSE
jgi:hypothetical protein